MVEVVEALLQRSGRGGNWMPSTTFFNDGSIRKVQAFAFAFWRARAPEGFFFVSDIFTFRREFRRIYKEVI